MKLLSFLILLLTFQVVAAPKSFTILPGEASFRVSGINVETIYGYITCLRPGLGSINFSTKYFTPDDLSIDLRDAGYDVKIKLPKMSVRIPEDALKEGCFAGIYFKKYVPSLIGLFGSIGQDAQNWKVIQSKLGDLNFVRDQFYSNLEGLLMKPYDNSNFQLCVDRNIEFGKEIRCPQ